jgi:hypothetical protein
VEDGVDQTSLHGGSPVRGSLRLSIMTSSPQVAAGTDFSIFVVIQNPFDIPITVYQVQTHIPIELIDVNRLRIEQAKSEKESTPRSWTTMIYDWLINLLDKGSRSYSGIAIAVGTDFDPEATQEYIKTEINLTQARIGDNVTVSGVQFAFPQNPSSEELDRIFHRLSNYQKGLIPVTLQPGDSIVKQFVLRIPSWLLFTPLTHMFQIQVNYSSDGVDHSDTIAYQQSIRATIGAMALGAIIGAVIGNSLKSLTEPSAANLSILQTMAASILASIAVVIAFARKSTAQPIVSVEDFWGGALIGFTTGFFGFDRFFGLFSSSLPR